MTAGFLFPAVMIPLLFVAQGIVSSVMSLVADYRRPSWSDIPAHFRNSWKSSLLLSLISAVFFAMSGFGIVYYSRITGFLGLLAAAMLFWISLGFYLTVLWFFPVRNRLTGGFLKLLKKSMLIMFDNVGISLFAGIIVVPLQMLLWPLTAFAAFGPAGIQLYMNGALRLLMFKYDWMETQPNAKRKDIPWFELLLDERERVGHRTLKGMIFPWKE
jgi:uncharacterized membrane protein YesL